MIQIQNQHNPKLFCGFSMPWQISITPPPFPNESFHLSFQKNLSHSVQIHSSSTTDEAFSISANASEMFSVSCMLVYFLATKSE
jgi:hypothetical protein